MSNCKYETSNGRCGLKGSYAYRHKCYGEDMCRCNEPKTNADHIRSMTDEELSEFLEYLYSHCDGPWEILFERKFCDHCHAPEYELEDGRNLKLHECDFTGGKCPHGSDVLWWLKQTYKEET